MDLFSKLRDAHRQMPQDTLNILFLFHPSEGSTPVYIRLAPFGDPPERSRSRLREIAAAFDPSAQPTLQRDGLYAMAEWQDISACAHVRVNPDGGLTIGRIWKNPKANVALPHSIEKKLRLAR